MIGKSCLARTLHQQTVKPHRPDCKTHSVTVPVPTMVLLLMQVKQICGRSTDKLIQNRGQLLVSLAEQLAEHAGTAESRSALDATLTALQCLEPPPVYRIEVRNLATCLQRLLWITPKAIQLHWWMFMTGSF